VYLGHRTKALASDLIILYHDLTIVVVVVAVAVAAAAAAVVVVVVVVAVAVESNSGAFLYSQITTVDVMTIIFQVAPPIYYDLPDPQIYKSDQRVCGKADLSKWLSCPLPLITLLLQPSNHYHVSYSRFFFYCVVAHAVSLTTCISCLFPFLQAQQITRAVMTMGIRFTPTMLYVRYLFLYLL